MPDTYFAGRISLRDLVLVIVMREENEVATVKHRQSSTEVIRQQHKTHQLAKKRDENFASRALMPK